MVRPPHMCGCEKTQQEKGISGYFPHLRGFENIFP